VKCALTREQFCFLATGVSHEFKFQENACSLFKNEMFLVFVNLYFFVPSDFVYFHVKIKHFSKNFLQYISTRLGVNRFGAEKKVSTLLCHLFMLLACRETGLLLSTEGAHIC